MSVRGVIQNLPSQCVVSGTNDQIAVEQLSETLLFCIDSRSPQPVFWQDAEKLGN
jgi:hypothetical protein